MSHSDDQERSVDKIKKGKTSSITTEQSRCQMKENSGKASDGWDFDDWDDNTTQALKNEAPNSEGWQNTNDLNQYLSEIETNTKILNFHKGTDSDVTSSWAWKPWGNVVSLLTTATESVSTLSSQVTQGFSNVIEKSVGVPPGREELTTNSGVTKVEGVNYNDERVSNFGSIVTGVTRISNKVITGGLDTLEEIGKKTMNILQENDHLLLKKRKLLGLENNKPVLSQVLREAKKKSEEIEDNLKEVQKQSYKKQLHFETLFDHYYGLIHLEALEMLSKQTSLKLQSLLDPLSGNARQEMEETLNEIKELCELGEIESDENDGLYDPQELNCKFSKATEDLNIQIDFDEILRCWNDKTEWLIANPENATEIYENGLRCLAETCALIILKMHKIAEILLIKEDHSTANEADALVQLTYVFCYHLNGIANRFGNKLNSLNHIEGISSMITSLFVEVYNSTSYVQNAFQLIIPILQIGAV